MLRPAVPADLVYTLPVAAARALPPFFKFIIIAGDPVTATASGTVAGADRCVGPRNLPVRTSPLPPQATGQPEGALDCTLRVGHY